MHLTLTPTIPDSAFPSLIRVLWAADEEPPQRFRYFSNPIFNDDYEGSLARSTECYLAQWRREQEKLQPEGAGGRWVGVVDEDVDGPEGRGKGRIVGGAYWVVHLDDPYGENKEKKDGDGDGEEGEGEGAFWYPAGTLGRKWRDSALAALSEPVERLARRGHVYLSMAFTHPEYRRRGVGNLFMKWGIEQADALGLECWLGATDLGVHLYKKHGFIPVEDYMVKTSMPEGLSDEEKREWGELDREMLPFHHTVMWRPVRGVYVDGVTVKPWEVGS